MSIDINNNTRGQEEVFDPKVASLVFMILGFDGRNPAEIIESLRTLRLKNKNSS